MRGQPQPGNAVHCHHSFDEVSVGSVRARSTAAPGRKQHAVLRLRSTLWRCSTGEGFRTMEDQRIPAPPDLARRATVAIEDDTGNAHPGNGVNISEITPLQPIRQFAIRETTPTANAVAFLQTALSELIRRSASYRYRAFSRRITRDRFPTSLATIHGAALSE